MAIMAILPTVTSSPTVRELTMPFEQSQAARPYRFGIVLLCTGALINWLGFAENYIQTIRYVGIVCIILGIFLIISSACFWAQIDKNRRSSIVQEMPSDAQIYVINLDDSSVQSTLTKPPDYETIEEILPPSYEDAVKIEILLKSHSYLNAQSDHTNQPNHTESPKFDQNYSVKL